MLIAGPLGLTPPSREIKLALIKQLLQTTGGRVFPLYDAIEWTAALALLSSPAGWVGLAFWAADWGSIGYQTVELIKDVQESHDDPCDTALCRRTAAWALGNRHVQEAILPLTAALQRDPDHTNRAYVVVVLAGLLDNTVSPSERYLAITALHEAAINDSNETVRHAAEAAYNMRKNLLPPLPPKPPLQQVVDQVTTATGDSSATVREAAVITIQAQGLRVFLPALLSLLVSDPAPRVRARCAQALGALLTRGALVKPVRAALQAATRDPDPAVQRAARAALAKTRWLVYSQGQLAAAGIGILAALGGGVWLWQKTPKALGEVDEPLMRRVANMLAYGSTKQDVRERLRAEGHSDHDIFLAYKAAEMLLET